MSTSSHHASTFDLIFSDLDAVASKASDTYLDHNPEESFHIIRNVLSMLNGLNVETVKKNPNDIFMLLKYSRIDGGGGGSSTSINATASGHFPAGLDDECCQLIIRIGGLGKLLLKIINYLNYYNQKRQRYDLVCL